MLRLGTHVDDFRAGGIDLGCPVSKLLPVFLVKPEICSFGGIEVFGASNFEALRFGVVLTSACSQEPTFADSQKGPLTVRLGTVHSERTSG